MMDSCIKRRGWGVGGKKLVIDYERSGECDWVATLVQSEVTSSSTLLAGGSGGWNGWSFDLVSGCFFASLGMRVDWLLTRGSCFWPEAALQSRFGLAWSVILEGIILVKGRDVNSDRKSLFFRWKDWDIYPCEDGIKKKRYSIQDSLIACCI